MIARRIGPNVGKIEIEGDKNSAFRLTGVEHSWIRVSSELLIHDGMHVMPEIPQQRDGIPRHVLIQLEPGSHPDGSGG